MADTCKIHCFGSDCFKNRLIFGRLNNKSIDLLISKLGDGSLLDMCVYWTKFGIAFSCFWLEFKHSSKMHKNEHGINPMLVHLENKQAYIAEVKKENNG